MELSRAFIDAQNEQIDSREADAVDGQNAIHRIRPTLFHVRPSVAHG